MTQITDYAYGKIRDYAISNFNYLEIQDDLGTPIKRFSTADGLTITLNAETQEIEYKVVVSGADTSFTNTTVSNSVIYDSVDSTNPIAQEPFMPFTFESTEDELTVIHKLQIPQIV